jgi:hypothetical protein
MPDPSAPLRAAMLSAVLNIEPRPADPFEVRVPAVRRVMPRITPPLELDAPIFRYFVHVSGEVTVLRDHVGARGCTSTHRRRRN